MATKADYPNEREKKLAAHIYKVLADKRYPKDDSALLLRKIFSDNGYHSILVNNKRVALSRATPYLPACASNILVKYGFPADPVNNPFIEVEVPDFQEIPTSGGKSHRRSGKSLESNVYHEEDLGIFIEKVKAAVKENGSVTIAVGSSHFSVPFGVEVNRTYRFGGDSYSEKCHYDTKEEAEEQELGIAVSNLKYFFKDNHRVLVEGSIVRIIGDSEKK